MPQHAWDVRAPTDRRGDRRAARFRRECVAVVGIAGQRLGMGDELAAGRAMGRGGDRHLDAEFVGPMRLALADALDLGRMQRVNLLSAADAGAARAPGARA
jgi:hypothetical protein